MSKHPATDASLREEALELLEKSAAGGTPDALERFCAESPEHAAAVQWARQSLAMLGRLNPPDFNPEEQQRIRRQAMWARIGEPRRITPLLAVMAFAALGALWIRPNSMPAGAEPTIAIGSQPTERVLASGRYHREVVLQDGSSVWLDWNSKLSAQFSNKIRSVNLLYGRAAFEVVSDSSRPFVVLANGLSTRVTGTEFVVDARHRVVEVAVIEGSVEVTDGARALNLGAAESARMDADTLVLGSVPEIDQLSAWREGRLVLKDVPLREALVALAPYVSFELDLTGLGDGDQRVSGTYFLERANNAVYSLALAHYVDVTQEEGRLVLSSQTQ